MSLHGKRILIVEDEAILAYDLEMIIREAGGDVVGPAFVVSDALELARTNQLSAAVLDVMVGVQDVYPVADYLDRCSVPFLFHTGHGSAPTLNGRWPRALVLAKPVASDRLIAELGRLVVRAGSSRP